MPKGFEYAENFFPSDAKLREMILYISYHSDGDETFGAVKLNKLLFFSDFLAYFSRGRSISGHDYQRLSQGPAPRALLPIVERMQADGDLAIRERDYYNRKQRRFFAIRPPDLSLFSADEVEIMQTILVEMKDKNASDVSGISHNFIGWELAKDGETIPYFTVWYDARKLTQEEKDYGKSLEHIARKYVSF